MSQLVSFPGLGLQFHVDPIAFDLIPGWDIYWYGLIIATGFLLAVTFCLKYAGRFGMEKDDLLDMLLFATPGAIVGARLYYVIFYLDLFRNGDGSLNFAKMLRIHDGGMAIYGSILAAVLIAYLVMRAKKLPFLAMADLCAFGLLIGQSVGRWGNFVNVEAFGGETSLPWRMGIMQKIDGVLTYSEVHPTFLYESLWNLLGFLLLLFLLLKGLRKFDGMLFFTYIAWYGFGRGIIEGLRTDSLYFFETGLRVSQILGLLSAIVALLYIIYRMRKRPGPMDLYVNRLQKQREEESDGSNNS